VLDQQSSRLKDALVQPVKGSAHVGFEQLLDHERFNIRMGKRKNKKKTTVNDG
jgi:hypothetical protein